MNTAACKEFIIGTINKNSNLLNSLAVHNVTDISEKKWVRVGKWVAKSADKIEMINSVIAKAGNNLDHGFINPGLNPVNCVVRDFMHRNADCLFVIITDPTDSQVVGYVFSIG